MQKSEIRAAFPLLQNTDVAYLDNAATAQKPQAVLDAVNAYYQSENANPLRGLYALSVAATEAYESARESVRAFLNAESTEEIIFTRNATESLNLIGYTYARQVLQAGDEILLPISEHHSNFLPWQQAAKATGAKLCFLECDRSGAFTPEMLKAALTPRTKIFACAQVSNVFGRIQPIREFARLCHANGTTIVVDGAQSVAHMPVDVRELDVDFFALSGHKMYAPMGIGALYGKRKFLEKMPPFLYGGEMIEYVTRADATYAELPHKFEAGTVNVGGAVGLQAAIAYIHEIGFDTIAAEEERLSVLAYEGLTEIPHLHLLGADDPKDHHGIFTFTLDGVHPHDIAAILDEANVAIRAGHHCTQPLHKHLGALSTVRASMAFYNTEEEVERLIAAVRQIRRKMGYGE